MSTIRVTSLANDLEKLAEQALGYYSTHLPLASCYSVGGLFGKPPDADIM